MSPFVVMAISVGLFSGIWGWLAATLGLITWAGFLATSSFFSVPENNSHKALLITWCCNLCGMGWGLVLFYGEALWGSAMAAHIMLGIISGLICLQAKQQWLSYASGAFIGCSTTIASGGNWALVAPSLFLGGLSGYIMKISAEYVSSKIAANKSAPTAEAI